MLRNVETVRKAIKVPLILENITATVLIPGAEMDEPEFVAAVLEAKPIAAGSAM